MRIYVQFFCPGYSAPWPDQYDEYSSIKDAKDAFWRICNFDRRYPNVDPERAEFRVYFGPPAEQDCEPDRIIRMGPRGGIRCERC